MINNIPPEFTSPLKNLFLKVNATDNYTLPDTYDYEGGQVTIDVFMGPAVIFT